MRKKFLVVLLFFLFTVTSFTKNIFVVYDDSKSMKKDNRNIYANYAMQTLISLLEEEDNLVITKMSDNDNQFRNKLIVDLKKIPEEIKYFREKINPISNVTPYQSVESMIDYINKMEIENDNNWLIVISDGYFEDGKEIPNIEIIEKKIEKVVKDKKIKPVFLLIGSTEKELETYEKQKGISIWKEVFGTGEYPKIYKSTGKKDIVNKMNEIAQLLTNKSFSNDENYKIENNKIVFSPLFPLNKIILLNQNDEIDNNIERILIDNIELKDIKIYSPQKNTKNLRLIGNIIHINNDSDLLNKGQVIIEFKDKVPNNIYLYPEVAGKFKVNLYDDENKEINNNFISLEEGKKIKVVANIQNIKNGENLKYREGTVVTINYGGKNINLDYNSKTNQYEAEIEVLKEKKSIDAIAEYKGYFYYQSNIYIIEGTPKKEIVKPKLKEVVKEEKPKIEVLKIYSLKVDKVVSELSQEELKNLKIKIVPKSNGKNLKKDEFKKFEIDIKSELKGKIVEDFNKWIFIPEIYNGKYGYKKPQGNFKLEIIINGNGSELKDEVTIKVKKISFIKNYGRVLAITSFLISLVVLIYGYITKKRFRKKSKILIKEYRDEFSKPDSYKKLKVSLINSLIPFISHKTSIDGIIFIANGRYISVLGENLSKKFGISRIKKIYINGDLIEKERLAKKMKYNLYNENGIKVIYEDNLVREYIYQN